VVSVWKRQKTLLLEMVFECAKCFFLLMAFQGGASFLINLLVLILLIYYRQRLLKSNDYRFLCSMIVADMLVGIFGMLYGALLHTGQEAIVYKLSAIIPMFSMMFASIASIAGMTANRALAVYKPLQYHTVMTSKRLRMSFTVIWLVPISVYVIQSSIFVNCTKTFELKVRSVVTVVFFVLGSLALGVSNCLLYIAVRRQIRLIKAHTVLTAKLKQLPQFSRNVDFNSERLQTTNGLAKDAEKAVNCHVLGFRNTTAADKDNDLHDTDTAENHAPNNMVNISKNKRDIFLVHRNEGTMKEAFPSPNETKKATKEQKIALRTQGRLNKVFSEDCFGISERSNACNVAKEERFGVTNESADVISRCNEKEIQETNENENKRPAEKEVRKGSKQVQLAKNVSKAIGRFQIGRKNENKIRMENLYMAHMCILVVLAFILCWIPLSIYRLRYVLGKEPIVWFRRFALFLAASNSLVNPFIYLLKQKTLRRHIKMLICKRRQQNS